MEEAAIVAAESMAEEIEAVAAAAEAAKIAAVDVTEELEVSAEQRRQTLRAKQMQTDFGQPHVTTTSVVPEAEQQRQQRNRRGSTAGGCWAAGW